MTNQKAELIRVHLATIFNRFGAHLKPGEQRELITGQLNAINRLIAEEEDGRPFAGDRLPLLK